MAMGLAMAGVAAAAGTERGNPAILPDLWQSPRAIVDLDPGWRFSREAPEGFEAPAFDDSTWRTVDLPHDWSIEDLPPLPESEPIVSITKGAWRFSRGDVAAWQAPGFDDSRWAAVHLPAAWEEHSGYKDDRCYGWFRRRFDVPAALRGRAFLLSVGWVKDADETFVNGEKVGGTGTFPPAFRGAETEDRYYRIAPGLVKGDGTDVVAVRVYKHGGYGGGIHREQMPHTRSGPFDTKAPNGASVGYTLGGTGGYRRHFTLPAGPASSRVRIEFDGVYQDADVWINGHHLGNHPYGYTAFGYDLTPHLTAGENVLAVRAKNEGANSRWYAGSGIYRHVRLVRTGEICIAPRGTFITTPEVSARSAIVRVRSTVTNATGQSASVRIRTRVLAANGEVVASGSESGTLAASSCRDIAQDLKVAAPALWSVDAPALYTAVTEVTAGRRVVDRVVERFGIRTIAFDAENGFRLNGQRLLLKGSCMHHDNGPLGAAAYDDAECRRVRLTKAAGFNAIRCSHNPPSAAFLDACDELGVLVIDEAFDVWKHGKGGSDFYSRHFDACWRDDLDSMVLRDRNHPCVILWSIGNEIPQNDTAPVAATARMLAARVRELDPTRPVTSGVQGVNPKKDEFFAALDVAGYNYAMKWNEGHTYTNNAYVEDHLRSPERVIVCTESFASQAFDYWIKAVDHPWVAGDFVWTGWDYLGESSIGWIGFGYPVYWPVAWCGDIDITGRRRPQSFYRGALFGHDAVAAFVRRPEPSFEHTRRYDWGFDDVQDSWTWPGQEGKNLGVVVFSSCDEVDLLLNGKSLGRRATAREPRYRAEYGVAYEPGTLKAVGYRGGQAVAEWTLATAGKPAALRLQPERSVMPADGKSLAYVPFEVVDAGGTVNPNADALVRFHIEGPAALAAVGSGDPSSLESFQQPQRKAWRGRGLVILRSTGGAGRVRVTASGDGLSSASVEIEAKLAR